MEILEVDYRQRPYDGKWQVLGKVFDHENAYTYNIEGTGEVTFLPTKWMTIGVYDLELEFVD